MKIILSLIITSMLSLSIANAASISSTNPELQRTYDDIKNTLGQVPTFVKAFPEESLPAVWEEMKSVQLSSATVLSPRMKELIGLAVAAQVPCQYCTYFHTEAAKLNGATEGEIKESILMAGATRHWGAFIAGLQYNEADFKKEVDRMVVHMREQLSRPKSDIVSTAAAATARSGESAVSASSVPMSDTQLAYQEMEKTYGAVPSFMKMFPQGGVAGAWKTLKAAELNPDSELGVRYKELIGLAVAAQMSCKECIYYHVEAAKANGASTEEIKETLAMSSLTRMMSTVLNGNQVNEKTFKRETQQIMRFVKAQSHKKVSLNETFVVKQ